MRYIKHFTILLVAFLLITSFSNSSNIGSKLFNNGDLDRDSNYIDSIIATLTIRQKVAQLFMVDYASGYSAKSKENLVKLVKEDGVGGLIAMGGNMVKSITDINNYSTLSKLPLLLSVDGEWGASMRFKELPAFPRQMQLGALSSDSLIYRMGVAIGKECRDLNIHINYAPCVDINNNPNNPAINTRSFGEDKEKVAKYATAYMQGMKDAGVAGSAKHFPGHGDTDVDSHKALPIIPFSLGRLDSLELYPFRKLIDAGVDMVMVGHLDVSVLDPGVPASISKKVITGFLRERLGYDGIICTDALNMSGVAKCAGLEKKMIPYAAYKAGADILLMAQDVREAITVIENAVKSGRLSENELDSKVKKVLALKNRLGLFSDSFNPIVERVNLEERVVKEENLSLIAELSSKSMTLLSNRDNLLPLSNMSDKKIALLAVGGEKYGKEFSKMLMNYTNIDTLILRSPIKLDMLKSAKRLLSNYDLIITVFNNTDSRPQKNFGIDSLNMNFITDWAAEQPMVASYFGSPYAISKMRGFNNFNSFILGYSNTLDNNLAAAQIIFGGAPALGVLPVSTSNFKTGESIILPKQTRLGYYIPSFKLENSGEFYVESNLIHGGLSSAADSTIIVNNGAPLFTLLPAITNLVLNDSVSMVEFVSDHIDVTPEHKDILIWDLLSHRSGLPAIADDYICTLESVRGYIPQPELTPEYSKMNLFYIEQIINKYVIDIDYIKVANSIFIGAEMFNSSIKSGYLETTPKDLAKFNFMLNNGGVYGGKQVLSSEQASSIKELLFYYL